MGIENRIQAIATNTAASAAEALLGSLPPEVSQNLSPSYLHQLEEDLRTELFSLIQSRLLWSFQAVQLELEQQHRYNQAVTPSPISTPGPAAPLSPPDYLQKPSASSELLAELRSGSEPTPAPGAAEWSPRKRIVTPRSSTYEQSAEPAPQSPDSSANPTTLPPASQAPQAATEETSKPSRRRRGREPQLTQEEIIKAYKIPPEWLNPASDPEAKPRRRRTSSAMA